MKTSSCFLALAVTLGLILSFPGAAPAAGPEVRIGSKDFTEELLLGEMYALMLEDADIPVKRRLNLAGTKVAHEALVHGEIDMYPEYTGTGYIYILGIKDGEKNRETVYRKVAEEYKKKLDLNWLDPAPMNNTNAIAVTREAADKYGLKTLSDLAAAAPNIRFSGIPDFEVRPDGLAGLKKLYGGFQFKELRVYDPGLKYKAVVDGQADAVIAFSTDGQIDGYGLVLMEDDKGLWPPYQVAPVVRSETLKAYPKIPEILDRLAPHLDNAALSSLNWQVDGKKREYTEVAREFLTGKGLIK
jgi:osmoprotectant transport system substrate-binding protein